MELIIETRGLTKTYRWKEAVHHLDIRLTAGRACAFLGRNGAGKTTTIKMLAGLIRPTSGQSFLFGRDSQSLRPEDWQKIGYVSENQELYDWMTGRQLIDFMGLITLQDGTTFEHLIHSSEIRGKTDLGQIQITIPDIRKLVNVTEPEMR